MMSTIISVSPARDTFFLCVGILHDVVLLNKVDFPVFLDGICQKYWFRVDEALISANMKGRIQERRQEQWPLKSKCFA
jgi:hypothetical protein